MSPSLTVADNPPPHPSLPVQVRMRDTFMKVGQSLMVKKQLVNEKGLKEKMIHSVMPPKVSQSSLSGGQRSLLFTSRSVIDHAVSF